MFRVPESWTAGPGWVHHLALPVWGFMIKGSGPVALGWTVGPGWVHHLAFPVWGCDANYVFGLRVLRAWAGLLALGGYIIFHCQSGGVVSASLEV